MSRSLSSPRPLQLLVVALVPASSLHIHDQDLPGVYHARVDSSATDTAAARAIMDEFFKSHHPRRPDDMLCQVFEGTKQLHEGADTGEGVEVSLGQKGGRPPD